jgi:hypothetical protein
MVLGWLAERWSSPFVHQNRSQMLTKENEGKKREREADNRKRVSTD